MILQEYDFEDGLQGWYTAVNEGTWNLSWVSLENPLEGGEDSNYIYESGTPIQVGDPGEHDFVYASGESVVDAGESPYVFESGTGVRGGLRTGKNALRGKEDAGGGTEGVAVSPNSPDYNDSWLITYYFYTHDIGVNTPYETFRLSGTYVNDELVGFGGGYDGNGNPVDFQIDTYEGSSGLYNFTWPNKTWFAAKLLFDARDFDTYFYGKVWEPANEDEPDYQVGLQNSDNISNIVPRPALTVNGARNNNFSIDLAYVRIEEATEEIFEEATSGTGLPNV